MQERTALEDSLNAIGRIEQELDDQVTMIGLGEAEKDAKVVAEAEAALKKLKADGIGIFLISHDIHDVFDLADRICVMKNGRVVGTARVADVTKDEVLGMIILGKCPQAAIPGPGAIPAETVVSA